MANATLSRIGMLEDIRAALDAAKPIITNSECTKTISYDSSSSDLTIEFQERGTYVYHNVPSDEYLGLKDASSHGQYFNLYIRDRYDFERIE